MQDSALKSILNSYPFANNYDLNDSNVFIFLKARDEYHDSWVYFVKEGDSAIDVDFRVLPSFTKTGYDSYHSDSNHFVFYEGFYDVPLQSVMDNKVGKDFQQIFRRYTSRTKITKPMSNGNSGCFLNFIIGFCVLIGGCMLFNESVKSVGKAYSRDPSQVIMIILGIAFGAFVIKKAVEEGK